VQASTRWLSMQRPGSIVNAIACSGNFGDSSQGLSP
jgi:hypothetical protein